MKLPKEQNQLIDLNNSGILSMVSSTNEMNDNGFHFKEVIAWVMSHMGLEFNQEYPIQEIIDKVIASGNTIKTVKGRQFNTSIYQGIKTELGNDFKVKTLLNLLFQEEGEEDRREHLEYILQHLEERFTIHKASIQKAIVGDEYWLLLTEMLENDKETFHIIIVSIPY